MTLWPFTAGAHIIQINDTHSHNKPPDLVRTGVARLSEPGQAAGSDRNAARDRGKPMTA
jgi:hypothetical protein